MFKIKLYNLYFSLLLLTLISVSVFEIHYIFYFLTIIILQSNINKAFLNIILLLVFIIFISIFSSLFNDFVFYNWIKDFAYFSRPILAIVAGYLISKKIGSFKKIIEIVILISTIFAFMHIFKVLFFVDFSIASVSDIRKVGGISNEIEMLALVLLFISNKYSQIEIFKNDFLKNCIILILVISFVLYFSRTMFVTFFILLLAGLNYLKITKKGIKYASLIVILFLVFYAYLFSVELRRDQSGLESFLYKMKNAPAEIFSPVKNIDTKNHALLWDRWRAYEAYKAIEQLNSINDFIFGKGLGSLVDLKFDAPLGEKNMRYIPTLHNGYVTILYKSGFLGFFFYSLFLFHLYLFSYKKTDCQEKKIITNLIGGFAVFYTFTSLIVTGIYNIMEPFVFILGMLLYFGLRKEHKSLI